MGGRGGHRAARVTHAAPPLHGTRAEHSFRAVSAPPPDPAVRHLLVDARTLVRNRRGTGRYTRALLVAMVRERPALRCTLLARDAKDVAPLREQLASLDGVAARSTVIAARAAGGVDCDAAWYPTNFVLHRPRSGAIVPTIHDLYPMLLLDGRWWKVLKRTRARLRYARTVALADRIVTGAEASAAEIARTFGVPRERIAVVPHAADDFAAADPACADALLARLGVAGPFLLAVGSQEPRKNLPVLYEAMRRLAAAGRTIPLVLCGPRGVHGLDEGDAAPPWLRVAGFVDDATLAALYARATALVFPSYYEGFGLPVLEALAVGGTVIASDASTLPEVGGDAVLYFPPRDADALAACVTRLLDDPALAASLRARAPLQAARFSWARSARGTLAALDAGVAAHRARR